MNNMNLKDAANSIADDVGGTLKATGREALDAAKTGVGDLAASAGAALRDEAEARAEEGKGMLADQGQRLADGLLDAAADRGETIQGRVLETLAGGVSDMSEGLRGRSVMSLLDEVQVYARRNPGIFMAAAAVAGFAVARFAVASSSRPVADQADDEDGDGDDDGRSVAPAASQRKTSGSRSQAHGGSSGGSATKGAANAAKSGGSNSHASSAKARKPEHSA